MRAEVDDAPVTTGLVQLCERLRHSEPSDGARSIVGEHWRSWNHPDLAAAVRALLPGSKEWWLIWFGTGSRSRVHEHPARFGWFGCVWLSMASPDLELPWGIVEGSAGRRVVCSNDMRHGTSVCRDPGFMLVGQG